MSHLSCNGEPVDAALVGAALVNYGHFTSLQVRGGAVQGWALHMRRLQQGTRELFDAELDEARLLGWLRQALAGCGMADASVRITVFSRAFDFRQPLRAVPVDVLIGVAAPAVMPAGARAVLPVRYQRELPQLKHVGTFPLFQYRRLAMRQGFDDALFVDAAGRVGEGSTWNIAFLAGDGVVWPRAEALRGTAEQLLAAGLERQGLAQAWREAHKVQAWFHDKGIGHAPKLRELEQQREEHRAEWQRLGQRIEEASLRVQHVRQQAHQRITAEQEPTLAKLAELEALQKEKARQEREAEAKRLQQQRIEREREEESMAALEHRLAELRAAQEADATQPEPSDNDPRWAAFERTFMHAAQFEHYLSLTVLAAPLAGLKARFAAYMDTAAEQGMTPEMFAQACAKGMAEQERRAMQEQAARDADPKQPQEDSPVSTPTP